MTVRPGADSRRQREPKKNARAVATSVNDDAVAHRVDRRAIARAEIDACFDRTRLEDLYLPFKPARRTKATVAREKGLEPLADFLMTQLLIEGPIEFFAEKYVNPEKAVSSPEEALEGAGYIVAERISTDADVRALVRARMLDEGIIKAHPTKNAEGKKTKFETYYNFSEPIGKIPSHRLLAVLRGLKEGVLRMELVIES